METGNKRLRLLDQHKEQIAVMLKDNKPWKEIIDFMKATYGLKIKNYHVAYVKKTMTGAPQESKLGGGIKKRAYHRKKKVESPTVEEFVKDPSGMTIEQIVEDIIKTIPTMHSVYRDVLLRIRGELIREVAKVRILKERLKEYEIPTGKLPGEGEY